MRKLHLCFLVAGFVLFSSSCLKEVGEPTELASPSFLKFKIDGWANPTSLLVPENFATQMTTISVRVSTTEQVSLAGREVIFQQFDEDKVTGIGWGYFEGNQLSIKKTVDSQGNAQVKYYFPGAFTVAHDTVIYIKATVTNTDQLRIEIYDLIPVYIKVYDN